MSTNGQLVFTDVDKITFKGVGNASNAVVDTLTGKIGVGTDSPEANLHVLGNSYVSTNLELGGTLIMGTVNVEAQHSLEAVTATGNTTPLTLEFTNPTTSLVASGNVEVGGDVVLSGNIYNNANLSVQYTTTTSWTQVGQDIDGEAAGDYSGYSVSISSDGTRMAVGAYDNDGTSGSTSDDRGHVRVYDWNSGTSLWTQVGQDIDGEAADDQSGHSVSISSDGTRVAIGAYGNDAAGTVAGHVRVFSLAVFPDGSSTWSQVGLDIDGGAVYDYSGRSVSMSSDGTRVAIGSSRSVAVGGAGHVRVFYDDAGTWTQVGNDIDGEAAGDLSGWSVSMSSDGTRVAIGAPYNGATGYAGHVRVFYDDAGTWTQVGNDIDGEAANDYSGWSVSISSDGTRVAIGAYGNDATGSSQAGHVRVFYDDAGTWTQVGQDIDGEASYDYSGRSVSISSDGTRVAIGAYGNDATGSSQAGHVRVYSESSGAWSQVGSDIDGEAAGDKSGMSVSISSDGTRVAVGAPFNDGTDSEAGHVRVFDYIVKPKKILKEDVEMGGELTVNGNVIVTGNVTADHFVGDGSNITGISSTLQAITDSGPGANVTSNTVQFSNAITGFVTTANVEVGGELTVSGNVAVDTNTLFVDSVNDRVGIGTTSPIASLDIDGGPESDIVPALSIRGGLYDTSDLYVLNTYNVNTGVGYAAKVIGVNIKNKVETDNTVQLRNNVGGLTSAGAIYLGSDNATNQGVFGVLTCEGVAGTALTEKFTVTDSGNVGIGALSPNWPLEVSAGNDSITYYGPNSSWTSYLAVGAADDKTIANNSYIAQCITTNGNLHLDAAHTRDIYMNHYRGSYIRHGGSGLYSDDRLKSEEELITNATDTLLKLSPQKYLKRRTLREDEDRDPIIETGLMAQDMWYDAPELRHLVYLGADANPVDTKPVAPVDGDIQQDPDYSSWGPNEACVNYHGLIAYLIKSNQELHARIAALENVS